VAVQIQNFLFFGKFVARGIEKVVFLRDVICERPLMTSAICEIRGLLAKPKKIIKVPSGLFNDLLL